jgi:transposase-like protein
VAYARKYSVELQEKALKMLMEPGARNSQVAKALDIPYEVVYKWCQANTKKMKIQAKIDLMANVPSLPPPPPVQPIQASAPPASPPKSKINKPSEEDEVINELESVSKALVNVIGFKPTELQTIKFLIKYWQKASEA